ncbi:MAG: nuclease (SNase domain protein) [Acidimicrobiales bacterium]|nr:nuclease (SNase domain protein) [Acidimicrobiales bacterium]
MPLPRPPFPPLVRVLFAALALAPMVCSGCARGAPAATVAIPGQPGRGVPATVTHVVDGDTVDLALPGGTERGRLLGIDTPETVKPDAPVECFGPEASARTKDLLAPGTPVLVQRDVEARDRYGRLLVYLWRREDGLFVNRALVAEGLARTLSISPNTTHRAGLARVAAAARSSGVGLWGSCPAQAPPAASGPGGGAGPGP